MIALYLLFFFRLLHKMCCVWTMNYYILKINNRMRRHQKWTVRSNKNLHNVSKSSCQMFIDTTRMFRKIRSKSFQIRNEPSHQKCSEYSFNFVVQLEYMYKTRQTTTSYLFVETSLLMFYVWIHTVCIYSVCPFSMKMFH